MWKQSNLFGENLELKKGDNPLEDLCCESCYNAEEETCVCRCHGAFHGLGRLNSRSEKEETKEK
jgi:hypothetical protein